MNAAYPLTEKPELTNASVPENVHVSAHLKQPYITDTKCSDGEYFAKKKKKKTFSIIAGKLILTDMRYSWQYF